MICKYIWPCVHRCKARATDRRCARSVGSDARGRVNLSEQRHARRMADEVALLMNRAKRDVVLATLKANGNECAFATLFAAAEEAHCDVLSSIAHIARGLLAGRSPL